MLVVVAEGMQSAGHQRVACGVAAEEGARSDEGDGGRGGGGGARGGGAGSRRQRHGVVVVKIGKISGVLADVMGGVGGSGSVKYIADETALHTAEASGRQRWRITDRDETFVL